MNEQDRDARLRRLRLATGLVLFAYVATHLLNHSLGLVSLAAQEAGRTWFLALWRGWAGTIVLYGALAIHFLLALHAIYRRRRFRLSRWEWTQLLFGLAIPPLLLGHVIGTRLVHDLYGVQDSYAYIGLVYWVWNPDSRLLDLGQQLGVLVLAWVHGCIGLHFWLRLKPGYRRNQALAFAAILLLPVLATLGFVAAGREVARLAEDPAWLSAAIAALNLPSGEEAARLYRLQDRLFLAYAAMLAATLAARSLRNRLERRRGVVRIAYPDGRSATVQPGTTVLEASRIADIPHASVCGGRGRCSTCRVRVGRGIEALPPVSDAEARVLRRVGAPPNVRLACQLRPVADVQVAPLLPPGATPRHAGGRAPLLQGEERIVAVMFADLRSFTKLSEQKLPYDVVFVLNRYFAAMGAAIEGAGGRVDKFIGDGIMALFGIDSPPDAACRQALAAAAAMGRALEELNRGFAHDLPEPLRIGIGIHVGPAIVGEMGYAQATSVTAIGDTVNTASRLEGLTKEFAAQLVVSEALADLAGADLSAFEHREVPIRGRDAAVGVRVVDRVERLPPPAAG